MDYISARSKKIDASGIRKIWELAQKMKDPVDFSIGSPDFDAPAEVKQAAIDAISGGSNGYTLTAGIAALREKIASDITAEFGWEKPLAMVTCGVSGALHLAFMATLNPGDEVLVPDPYFVMYHHLTNLSGGTCVYVDTYPDFHLSAEKVAEKITSKTKMLVLNSPGNPTGAIYTEQQLKDLADLARKHELLVISDEIYKEFSYDRASGSIASYYENTIVMRGMSKAYGIPGWRMGYMALPNHLEELFERMAALQQYTFVCAPQPFQLATIKALDHDCSDQVDIYRKKRDLVYEGLKGEFDLVKPEGAFYAFVPTPNDDATEFVTRAIANDVLVIPGKVFSSRDTHFRISYATSEEKIKVGCERLCKIAREY